MRTIILSIADNQVAEQFVRDFDRALREGGQTIFMPEGAVTLDAMIARPTLACECTATQKRRGRHGPKVISQFTRLDRKGRPNKFGWLLCARCRRPTSTVVRDWIKNMVVGAYDLLPEIIPGRKPVERHDVETEQAVQLDLSLRV